MEVTKPYEFMGFGAMEATKPYKFIGFGGLVVGQLRPLVDAGRSLALAGRSLWCIGVFVRA
jgi:hypothetical protein